MRRKRMGTRLAAPEINFVLTEDERQALGWALDLAFETMDNEIQTNDLEATDADHMRYAQFRLINFNLLGEAGEKLNYHGERARWQHLSADLREAVRKAKRRAKLTAIAEGTTQGARP